MVRFKSGKLVTRLVFVGIMALILVMLSCAKAPVPTPSATAPAPKPSPAPPPTSAAAPKATPAPASAPTIDKTGWPGTIAFGGASTGSTPHLVVTAYGNMVQKYIGVNWSYQPGLSSMPAAQAMGEGKLDISAQMLGGTIYLAPRSQGPFEGKPKITNMRLLFPSLVQAFQTVTRTSDNIKTIKDFKGKRYTWMSGSYDSLTYSEAQLGSAGLTWDSVQRAPATQEAAACQMLTEKKTDILSWIENPLSAAPLFLDMERIASIYLVPLTTEQQKYISDRMPYFPPGDIKANLYKGQDKPVPTNLVPQSFSIRKEIPDSLVYELMKIAFDRNDELRAAHPLMGHITPDYAVSSTIPIPWHAGAVRYWKEKNLWKQENDNRQKALLTEIGQDK